jgi:hypothetical protein
MGVTQGKVAARGRLESNRLPVRINYRGANRTNQEWQSQSACSWMRHYGQGRRQNENEQSSVLHKMPLD